MAVDASEHQLVQLLDGLGETAADHKDAFLDSKVMPLPPGTRVVLPTATKGIV